MTRNGDHRKVRSRALIGSLPLLLPLFLISGCGHARAGEAKAARDETTYAARVFATGLDRPQAIAPVSDDTVLVAERSGHVKLIGRGGPIDLGPITVPGPPIFYVKEAPFTEGLKDLIADPRHPGKYIWCMTTGTKQSVAWTVGRATVSMDPGHPPSMTSQAIWRSVPRPWGAELPFSGCRMVVDGDDVVVAMGANQRKFGSGRIVRVPLDGAGAVRTVSTGHRNPGGIAMVNGVFWETEFGPTGGDELNVIVAGRDYGWPEVSKGEPDDGSRKPFLKSRSSSVDPVVSWSPSLNPAGMTASNGRLYIAALTGVVIELTVDGSKVTSQKRISETDERLRDVRPGRDGKLWVVTDGPDGQLLRLTPSRAGSSPSETQHD